MKVVGIIQARMSSSRLPGKILAPVAGRPLLSVLAGRLRSAGVDAWWLATSDRSDDDVAAAWGSALGINVYRGDLDDVLSRFLAIARHERPDWIVRITADDPFMDGAIVDRLIDHLPAGDEADVLGPGTENGFPLGYVPEIIRADALKFAAGKIPPDQAYHRSHVTSIFEELHRYCVLPMPEAWPRRGRWRWTVDTFADLQMADAAFRRLGNQWQTASYREIVALLDQHPDITSTNASVQQKTLIEG